MTDAVHHDPAESEADDLWAAGASRSLRDGSRDALADVFTRCGPRVANELRRIVRRDDAFVLDCVQEMFMRLARNPPVVDSHAALLAWMRVASLNIARNAILAEQRRAARESAHARAAGAGRAVEPLAEGDGAASLDSIDAALGEEERALLQLRYRDGLSVDAIARSLGAAPRRIESALRRALAKARKTASAAEVRKSDANRRTP